MQGKFQPLHLPLSLVNLAAMPAIRINAAAELLGVSPSTLRSWERRFGFPTPRRSAGGHRQFDLHEIEQLRCALAETGEISAAIALVSTRGGGPPTELALAQALGRFDGAAADRLLEESLAVRTLERTVEEVLLAALRRLRQASEGQGAEYCFGWRHATAWLASFQRLSPPASRPHGVLIFDATSPLDLDSLYIQALELWLRRSGLRLLSLPTSIPPGRLGAALRALQPQLLILAGGPPKLDRLARLVYATRQLCPGVGVVEYRGGLPSSGASTVPSLPPASVAAAQAVLAFLDGTGQRRLSRAS
jgi:DNA-binding transcriptional MerR regulator